MKDNSSLTTSPQQRLQQKREGEPLEVTTKNLTTDDLANNNYSGGSYSTKSTAESDDENDVQNDILRHL